MSERPKRKGQVSPRTPHPALILREPPALALEPDHSSAEPCGGEALLATAGKQLIRHFTLTTYQSNKSSWSQWPSNQI